MVDGIRCKVDGKENGKVQCRSGSGTALLANGARACQMEWVDSKGGAVGDFLLYSAVN